MEPGDKRPSFEEFLAEMARIDEEGGRALIHRIAGADAVAVTLIAKDSWPSATFLVPGVWLDRPRCKEVMSHVWLGPASNPLVRLVDREGGGKPAR